MNLYSLFNSFDFSTFIAYKFPELSVAVPLFFASAVLTLFFSKYLFSGFISNKEGNNLDTFSAAVISETFVIFFKHSV